MLAFVPSDDLCNAFADQAPSIDASCRQTDFLTPGIYSSSGDRSMEQLREHMREHVHVMLGSFAHEVKDQGLRQCVITAAGVLLPEITTYVMNSLFVCDEAVLEALYRRLSAELRAWLVAQGNRISVSSPAPFNGLSIGDDGEVVMSVP